MNGYPADAIAFETSSTDLQSERAKNKLASDFQAELLQTENRNIIKECILEPITNLLIIRPSSAAVTTANLICRPLLKKEAFPAPKEAVLAEQKPFSPQWLLQQTTYALASACPFVALTIATKHTYKAAAGRTLPDSLALVSSGTVYEGLREPLPNESRSRNAAATFAMLTMFEGGNHLSKNLSGLNLTVARAGSGFLAGAAANIVQQDGSDPSAPKQLFAAASTAAIMNMIIPSALSGIARLRTKNIAEITPVKKVEAPQELRQQMPKSSLARAAASNRAQMESKGQIEYPVCEGVYENTTFESLQDYCRRGIAYGRRPMSLFEIPSRELSILVPASAEAEFTAQKVLKTLEHVPDPSLIRKVLVSDHPHRYEPWIRQEHPEMKILAESEPNGTITLHRPDFSEETNKTMVHEWNHLLKFANRASSEIFDGLHWKEPLKTTSASRIHNEHNHAGDEAWAIMSEDLLSSDPISMAATAFANPIKSSIWAKTMRDHLDNVSLYNTGAAYQRASEAANFISEHVRPDALSKLEEMHSKNQLFKAVNEAINYLRSE